ncbi:hypothetical protein ABT324_24225 [Saccharopolyspora sp. NPDC000359]|uniref:hypothetical protein n=1 Tax=Saccharopolyspora sp. NPDC000359 TaxID=3154251 RepID=UPI00332C6D4B
MIGYARQLGNLCAHLRSRKEVNRMRRKQCCCAELHNTMRLLIFAIATLAHGMLLMGHGMYP